MSDAGARDLPDQLAPTVRDGAALAGDARGRDHATALATGLPLADAAPTRVGRYQIEAEIGAGAMGVVYRARDPELDRTLAIKLVTTRRGATSRDRLLREAQAMAKVRHPNVVPIFDVGTHGDGIFVVMPLISGGTLRAWMRAARRSWQDVVDRLTAAGRGLAAAHAAGLVHRDFKPDNVLVGDDGEVMVADFGLALATSDDTAVSADGAPSPAHAIETSSIAGTPAYMAPEQRAGAALDARTDQFAFCVAFWEGLFGERPGDAATRTLVRGPFASRTLAADAKRAPAWLAAALERGLSADPARRWPSIAALLDHVRARRQRPRRVALAAAAATVAASVAVAGWSAARHGDAPAPDGRPSYGDATLLARFGAQDDNRVVGITPAGMSLIVWAPTRGEFWLEDVASGARVRLDAPAGLVPIAVHGVDGGGVFVAGSTTRAGHGIWRLGPGAPARRLVDIEPTRAFAVRRDGTQFAIASAGRAQRFDGTSGLAVGPARQVDATAVLAFGEDDALIGLAAAGAELRLTDLTRGSSERAPLDPELSPLDFSWSPLDGYLVSTQSRQLAGRSRSAILQITRDSTGTLQTRDVYRADGDMVSDVASTDRGIFLERTAVHGEVELGKLGDGLDHLTRLDTRSRGAGRIAGWIAEDTLLVSVMRGDTMGVARLRVTGDAELVLDTDDDDIPLAAIDGETFAFARGAVCAVESARVRTDRPRIRVPVDCARGPIFVCAEGHAPCLLWTERDGAHALAAIDLRSGAVTGTTIDPPAAPGRLPSGALSRDGTQLLWAAFTSELTLYDMRTGGRRTLLADPARTFQCVGWGHDGTYVIATQPSETSTRILRVNLDGTSRELATLPTWACDPRVSPDGAHLAFRTIDLSSTAWLLPRTLATAP
jgi:predicted Ser/Thr protein kinase